MWDPIALKPEIEKIIEDELRESKIPGIAIGIYQGEKELFVKGTGYAENQSKKPITPTTVFRLASISKLFTTIGLMQLWEKKYFDLDDPVNKYLPKGKILPRKPNWPAVTIHHLLTHQSGIGELARKSDMFKKGFGMNVTYPEPIPPISVLFEKDVYTDIPAGTKYAYCNFAFALLGYLIEILSGLEFCEYMDKFIFRPLGMKDSGFQRTPSIQEHEAKGYTFKLGSLRPATYYQGIIKPAGMLYSTMEDMHKFGAMLLQKGTYQGIKIIESATLDLCWTPQYYAHPSFKDTYALGLAFHLFSVKDHRIIEHGGLTSGFTSCFSLLPEVNISMLVSSNLDEIFHTDKTQIINNRIIQFLLGIQTQMDWIGRSTTIDSTLGSKYLGYYGNYPGILTNTRILLSGGDYRINITTKGLSFSSFYGVLHKRGGKILYPTSNPLVFEYETKPGSAIRPVGEVGFIEDKQGKIIALSFGFFKLRRNSFLHSLRLKIYCIVAIILGLALYGIGSIFL